MLKRLVLAPLLASCLGLTACAVPTFETDFAASSTGTDATKTFSYVYEDVTGDPNRRETGKTDKTREDLHLVLALSGVGSKGSAFAFGVLEALKDVKADNGDTLLDQVDVISAVSATSGVAMSFGLARNEIFDPNNDEHYVLTKHPLRWEADTLGFVFDTILKPFSVRRLLTLSVLERYSIPDLIADYFSEEVFDEATYRTLVKQLRRHGGKPYIILGASDIVRGQRFEFSQPHFDFLCSDLGSIKIGRAVAAASIPPVLTTGVRLRNFPKSKCPVYIQDEVDRIGRVLSDHKSARRGINTYLRDKSGAHEKRTSFVHLTDGTIVDSLALRPIVEGLNRWGTSWSLRRVLKNDRPKKVLIVAANMRNKMPHETNFDDSGPGQLKQIFPVLSLANSGQSTDQFELARLQLLRTMTLLGKAAPDTEIIPPIFISSGDEPNGALRDCLESFEVKSPHLREDMLAVKRLARRALYGNKNLKAFMDENGWQPAKETGRSGGPALGNGTCSEYE